MACNLIIYEWVVMPCCNLVGKQLFGQNYHQADNFARLAYQSWTIEGIAPEELRDRGAPGMSDRRRLRKWKQLKAKGLIARA